LPFNILDDFKQEIKLLRFIKVWFMGGKKLLDNRCRTESLV